MKELVLQLLPLGDRQTGGRTQDLGIGWVAHGGRLREGHGVALLSSQPQRGPNWGPACGVDHFRPIELLGNLRPNALANLTG